MKVRSAEFIKGIRGTNPITHDGTPQVAFVGRSNAGKSSLINSLTGQKKLVKVSDKAGKTTEINFFLIDKKFYLVDLPGYGFAKANLEFREKLKKLIYWYLTAEDVQVGLVVIVIDSRVGITPFDKQMIEILSDQGHNFLIAANKIDKLSKNEAAKQIAKIKKDAGEVEVIASSAVVPKGSDDLLRRIYG